MLGEACGYEKQVWQFGNIKPFNQVKPRENHETMKPLNQPMGNSLKHQTIKPSNQSFPLCEKIC